MGLHETRPRAALGQVGERAGVADQHSWSYVGTWRPRPLRLEVHREREGADVPPPQDALDRQPDGCV